MNRRIMYAVLMAVLLTGAVAIVGAQSQLPGNGWTTGFQFQNVGSAPTDVLLVAYDQNGVAYDCGVKNAVSGGSVNFLFDNDCPTPADFSGSAVIQSNEPTRGIVHVNNAPSGKAGGIYAGTTLDETANEIFFPLVKHNHFGRTTTFYVQNAQQTPVNITATFRVQGSTFTKQYNNVAPAAMVVVNPADVGVPGGNGQVGSLSVAASGPVAGTSLEHQHAVSTAENLQASKAFTPADYDTTSLLPPVSQRPYCRRSDDRGAGPECQQRDPDDYADLHAARWWPAGHGFAAGCAGQQRYLLCTVPRHPGQLGRFSDRDERRQHCGRGER